MIKHRLHIILLLSFFVLCATDLRATTAAVPGYNPTLRVTRTTNDIAGVTATTVKNGVRMGMRIEDGDTLYLAWLRDIYVYPPMKFKSKKQERFYWRTVRDVKKTLPYAKLVAKEMQRTDSVMRQMDKRQKRKFWKQYEKTLMQQYKVDLSKWTAAQGQMLMKLIDRETSMTSYEVIELYKGTFVANIWQMVAKAVGNDLKEEYDGDDKDKIVERIITLVEAGQL